MTISLYAARKGCDLPGFRVEVAHKVVSGTGGAPPRDRFDRIIAFAEPLDDEQRARLLEIADKCPVHRTLTSGVTVATRLVTPDRQDGPSR